MLVPYWRICDKAWHIGENIYLAGIGVERNYGGQLLVIPVADGEAPWGMGMDVLSRPPAST